MSEKQIRSLLERQQASILAEVGRAKPTEVEPLHDWVLVRRERKGVTEGGLHVPNAAQEKEADGVVIAVGPGTYQNGILVPPGVQVGDRVMCDPANFFAMPAHPGHILIRAIDILARRKPPAEDLQ
jgi:co-chaperonin GroES (HSP10)